MNTPEKLSIYLNRFYSYPKIRDSSLDEMHKITINYIRKAEKKIFKQPIIAQRAIKLELLDVYGRYNSYKAELNNFIDQINEIVRKGPKLAEEELQELEDLEQKRDLLGEFVYSIEDSLGYITRLLLEHYEELSHDKIFTENFVRFLGPFDIISNQQKNVKDFINNIPNSQLTDFQYLIGKSEITEAIEFLKNRLPKNKPTLLNDILTMQANLNNLRNEYLKGTISLSEYIIMQNKIVYSLLDLSNSILS